MTKRIVYEYRLQKELARNSGRWQTTDIFNKLVTLIRWYNKNWYNKLEYGTVYSHIRSRGSFEFLIAGGNGEKYRIKRSEKM